MSTRGSTSCHHRFVTPRFVTPRFDAVVFDWYATLGAPGEDDWWNQMFSMIENAGGVVPESAVGGWTTPELEHLAASRDEATYRTYEESQLYELFRASGLSEEVQHQLGPEVLKLRGLEHIALFPDVIELLEELRTAGVKVALCSNWSWDLDRHLAHNEVAHYFDVVICSAIVGYRKPHPGIFDVLLAQLEVARPGLERGRIAFVGDDWSADIEGATSNGLVPFHLARRGCPIEPHDEVPCASDLRQLRRYLFAGSDPRQDMIPEKGEE
jgi:HAD superfamily hydrolase (TIGR01549 family)